MRVQAGLCRAALRIQISGALCLGAVTAAVVLTASLGEIKSSISELQLLLSKIFTASFTHRWAASLVVVDLVELDADGQACPSPACIFGHPFTHSFSSVQRNRNLWSPNLLLLTPRTNLQPDGKLFGINFRSKVSNGSRQHITCDIRRFLVVLSSPSTRGVIRDQSWLSRISLPALYYFIPKTSWWWLFRGCT